ncbi:MAG: hypothetical protein ACI8WT_005096 [Clostridium sp.]
MYLTLPQFKHLCSFVFETVGGGCNGKVSCITENCYSSRHRTSAGNFSLNSPWNEDYILRALQNFALKKYGKYQRIQISLRAESCIISNPLI